MSYCQEAFKNELVVFDIYFVMYLRYFACLRYMPGLQAGP